MVVACAPPMRRPTLSAFAPLLPIVVLSGCAALTSPPETEVEPRAAALASAAPAPSPPPKPREVQQLPPKEEEKIGASHILVSYKEARSAAPNITRSKDQARKRAEDALKKAKSGKDFAALAKEYSDDPGSGSKGGDLGTFPKTMMVKPFGDAAFALKPGEISGIVETDFGFHVIKRTQ
jgi:parvulin-like peptidyl-prolyl isomerase